METGRGYSTFEHPLDVLGTMTSWRASGNRVALAIITRTEGGSVRAPGAMMAVSEDGRSAGYVSGGCIDSDVALHAISAIEEDSTKSLVYGAGSPFVDLPLPCGGSIEVLIIPNPEPDVISRICKALSSRKSIAVAFSPEGRIRTNHGDAELESTCLEVTYTPKLQVRIAGRGAESLSLAQMCQQAGFSVSYQSPDDVALAHAKKIGCDKVCHLTTPRETPDVTDDPWTAFVLMFHDVNWETALLHQAVDGPAFYIGAVGSKRAHQKRLEALHSEEMPKDSVERIKGPIGLVPSMREASGLAISTLAEIISCAPKMVVHS